MFEFGGGYGLPSGPSVSPLVAPNEVIIDDRSYTFDTEKLVENIKAGLLDGTDLYPILNAPGVIKGTEINQILLDFAELDEPEANPNRLFAPEGMTLQERSQTDLFKPTDFGNVVQDLGLIGLRGGQTLGNIGIGLANLGTGAYDAVSDYITGPDFQGAFGGREARLAASTEEAIARRAEPGKKFDYIPLTQPKDIAEMRINQMGDLILASSEIDNDLKLLLSGQVEREEEPDVVDTAKVEEVPEEVLDELPVGTVEIRNLSPEEYEDSNIRRLKYEMEMIGRDEFGNPLPESRLLQDPEIQKLLEEIKPAEVKVDVDKTEADSLAETAEKFEGEIDDEALKPKLPDIDLTQVADDEDDEESQVTEEGKVTDRRKQNDPISRKIDEPGFFGTNRFLDFIRNTGKGLQETGQIGSGLALGAAKAAEERAARDLLQFQEDLKFKRNLRLEEAKAKLKRLEDGPYDKTKIKTYVEFETNLTGALKNFDEDERIVSDLNQILNEDINDPNAFGVKGFITKISEDLRAAAGMGEKEWNNLAPAKRIQTILDVTAQRSVRNILGESGKTISNLDRELVANIFGSVNIFTSRAELKKKLEDSRAQIIEGMRNAQSTVLSNANALQEARYPSAVLKANLPLLRRILDFDFTNIDQYKLGEDTSGYVEISI